MRPIAIHVDVADLTVPPTTAGRRIAGLTENGRCIAVATIGAGGAIATTEIEFDIAGAVALAEQCLSGNQRALTTPGLARILAATAAVLCRVSLAAGALQPLETEDRHDGGDADDLGNQPAAGGDEDPGD